MIERPTVPYVLPLAVQVYSLPDYAHVRDDDDPRGPGVDEGCGHGVGGHLHIVLDDGNIDTGHVEFCLADAERDGCSHCALVAWLLLQMTKTQRSKVAAQASTIAYGRGGDGALAFAEDAYCPCAYHMKQRKEHA